MGPQSLWYIGGILRGGKMQGDDIIFPNLDMCIITLAGWFNKSLLKKNWNPRCNFLISEPPWENKLKWAPGKFLCNQELQRHQCESKRYPYPESYFKCILEMS